MQIRRITGTIGIIVILFIQSIQGQQQAEHLPDTADIARAAALQGLQFDSTEMNQMNRTLAQQKSQLEAIREFSLENSVRPALQFNPFMPEQNPLSPDIHPEWIIPFGIEKPEKESDLAFMSLPELASLIKYRKMTSTELTLFFIERIKKYDPELLGLVTLTEAYALERAALADEELAAGQYRGILHGIPYGVKDLLAFPGYPTTWGAQPYRDQIIDYKATVIQRLEDQGAVMVAKLSLGALAMGDIWFGGMTRNPWNTDQGSSGSSAGPAAAVSAGLIPFAIGSETLGSIVSPSTRCAVTGLRPGFGRVSKSGAMALSWTMDKLGPICRSAMDCAMVFDALIGEDPADPTAIASGFAYTPLDNLTELRIGYVADLFESDYPYKENDLKALEVFRNAGADFTPVALPDTFPVHAMRLILTAEAAAAFDELTRSDLDSLLVSQLAWSWPNTFRSARFIPAVEYINANRIRSELVREMNLLLENFDCIVVPSYAGNQLTMTNLTGHPALLLPTGTDDKKQPTSITLIGPHFSEGILTAVGQLFQEKTGLHTRRPPKFD